MRPWLLDLPTPSDAGHSALSVSCVFAPDTRDIRMNAHKMDDKMVP